MSASRLILGDCLSVLPTLEAGSVDAVVTDPPYGLKFMGAAWDHRVPGVPYWEACLRVAKPGAMLLAFGGTRTYHRLACAIEDAGWQIRDCLMWIHAQGFPKGTGCLKPAYEPILLARQPGAKVSPLGIDECRVGSERRLNAPAGNRGGGNSFNHSVRGMPTSAESRVAVGRWPANVVHDGSEEVLEAFAAFGEKESGMLAIGHRVRTNQSEAWDRPSHKDQVSTRDYYGDMGSASRFFYCAKASKEERGEGNNHATVKPLSLMLWLVKLVCPPGGTVLDPYTGSGTTGVACQSLGRDFVGIEIDEHYHTIAQRRLSEAQGPLFAGTVANGSDSHPPSAPSQGTLFPEP